MQKKNTTFTYCGFNEEKKLFTIRGFSNMAKEGFVFFICKLIYCLFLFFFFK